MKFNTILSTIAMVSLLTVGAVAEENKTEVSTKASAPIVGGAIIDVSVTEIFTTGYRASKLLKSDIYNKAGDKIGSIDDFIVGGNSMVSLVVISVGGFLGMGARHVAVPVILIERNEKGHFILPNATKEDLIALPEFRYAK